MTGLHMGDLNDITPLIMLFDSEIFANALLRFWAWLNYSNHAWSLNEDFIKLAIYKLVKYGQSTIMLISSRGDGTQYFDQYVRDFVEIYNLPATTFVNYNDDLPYGLKLVYFCTPKLIDYFETRRMTRKDKLNPFHKADHVIEAPAIVW